MPSSDSRGVDTLLLLLLHIKLPYIKISIIIKCWIYRDLVIPIFFHALGRSWKKQNTRDCLIQFISVIKSLHNQQNIVRLEPRCIFLWFFCKFFGHFCEIGCLVCNFWGFFIKILQFLNVLLQFLLVLWHNRWSLFNSSYLLFRSGNRVFNFTKKKKSFKN